MKKWILFLGNGLKQDCLLAHFHQTPCYGDLQSCLCPQSKENGNIHILHLSWKTRKFRNIILQMKCLPWTSGKDTLQWLQENTYDGRYMAVTFCLTEHKQLFLLLTLFILLQMLIESVEMAAAMWFQWGGFCLFVQKRLKAYIIKHQRTAWKV